ncbi:MAG TPA: oxidoreductase [Methanomassiliicoccales archaeon]|nr:oxidoreductase [Methanomassiliicoccales archaeon]
MAKIRIAQYWGAGCGGCDVALLDIDEKVLGLAEYADIVFWPIAVDTKLKDVEAMPDGYITATLFNGAIRNSENLHVAKLLRQKSTLLISFGSCACFGGVPGLANITTAKDILEYVYTKTPSSDQQNAKEKVYPQTKTHTADGELELPALYETVKTLDQVVDVDYYMPGCPPTVNLITDFLTAVEKHVKEGAPLPPKGTVIASQKTLCDECKRKKTVKSVDRVRDSFDADIDPDKCMIEQGVICLGPATRAGCGAKCLNANQPCRGCMGPTAQVTDQGGSMLSALASVFKVQDKESQLNEEDILKMMSQVKDPLGTFYTYTMPKSIIKHTVKEKKARKPEVKQ